MSRKPTPTGGETTPRRRVFGFSDRLVIVDASSRLSGLEDQLRDSRREVRAALARAKLHDAEVARLRARVISVAAGGLTICSKCLSETEATNLRKIITDQRSQIDQLRALLAARCGEDVEQPRPTDPPADEKIHEE